MEKTHKCTLEQKEETLKWHVRLRLIWSRNPLGSSKFRSEMSIRNEQERHLKVNKYAIHPFSKFRAWYELYLIYLYGSLLITKPLDSGFIKSGITIQYPMYSCYTIITDLLSWIDIFLNFLTGIDNETKTIELRQLHIAKHYAFRYFIFDLSSSFPKCVLYYRPDSWYNYRFASGIVTLFNLLKLVRLISFVKYIKRAAKYILYVSQGIQFLLCSIIVFLMIVHWMACLEFAIPRLIRRSLSQVTNESWFLDDPTNETLYEMGVLKQYTHCLFKSSAYLLGIRIDLYRMAMPEEYILAICTYFIGKILLAVIWTILAVAILNSRLMHIKFSEIMNQLEEYMRQRQLPLNLRDRIVQYFIFKFGSKFFKETMISSLLSENLKRDTSLHICKALVKNVSLFSELTPMEISKLVNYLIPEIFLPHDVIIRAGTYGKVMYFISSGTVAVYSRSGKEICHLQDGAYFGEVALVLKANLRLANIVALETSQLYKLHKKDLERCLLINKSIRFKMLREAEERLKLITKLEEEYKEHLFGQTFRDITK